MANIPRFLREMQRRNVFRAAIAYLVVAWLLIQIADIILGAFAAPSWALRTFVVVLILGFPVALIVVWIYELTARGRMAPSEVSARASTTLSVGRQIDFIIIGVLLFGILLFAADRFRWIEIGSKTSTEPTSIAVLPFNDFSVAGDQAWLSDGITEEILNSLARLPELKVISRSSAFHFKGRNVPLDQIADMLNVEYIVEGSVRRVNDELRLTAKLIRNTDGAQVWSNAYHRSASDILQVQVEIAESIANALNVVLDDDQREFMFATGTRNVEAFEAFLKGRAIFDAVHRGDRTSTLWAANAWFEEAISLDPAYAAAHYMHHDAYPHYLMSDGADPMAPSGPGLIISTTGAIQRMGTDLENALANVSDQSLKANIEFDRTILLDSWHRLPVLIQNLGSSAQRGRSETRLLGWTDLVLTALGHAEITLQRAKNNLQSDPYESLNWINSATASLALDRPDDAIAYLERGRRLTGDHEFMNRVDAMAHLMLGDVESAARLYMNESSLIALAYALLGQEDLARQSAAEIEERNPRQEELILAYAVLGDQANVDRLTRLLDSSIVGSLQLLRTISYVAGRVPFNLKEAPNFMIRLRDAGIEPSSLELWVPQSLNRNAN